MQTTLSPQEIVARGDALYSERIRNEVETQHDGKFLIMDIETGDYELDGGDTAAQDRLQSRRPSGVFYGVRVGSSATYFIGGGGQE